MLWDPSLYAPPAFPENGEWESCRVIVREWRTVELVYQWLNMGNHPFRSVVIDSITEIQRRVIDHASGIEQPALNEWGYVLRVMEDHVRKIRDLVEHPIKPIECVCLITLTHLRDGIFRPFVRGQLELTLPGYVDTVGYMKLEIGPDGNFFRRLQIAPLGGIDAKDRTNVLLPAYGAFIDNPNLSVMVDLIDQATG